MKKAIIINSINDAQCLVEKHNNLLGEDVLILSTHLSAIVYLKEKHHIDAISLSSFIAPEKMNENMYRSALYANHLVDYLDLNYSAQINKEAGYKGIRFFRALYSYKVYLQFITCLNTQESLVSCIEKYHFNEVFFFDREIFCYGYINIHLSDILNLFPSLKLSTFPVKQLVPTRENKLMIAKIKRLFSNPSVILSKIDLKIRNLLFRLRCGILIQGRKTIFLAKPLYDLSFLSTRLLMSDYNILSFHSLPKDQLDNNAQEDVKFGHIIFKEYINSSESKELVYLKNKIIKGVELCWNKKARDYFLFLRNLDQLNSKHEIDLGIWGCPPLAEENSLLFEYLLQKNKPVIGAQHGGVEINVYNEDLYIGKMTRCTDFISYGFTKEEYDKVFPNWNIDHINIHALGTTKKAHNKMPLRPMADIIYPITNTVGLLDGNAKRNSQDEIVGTQIKLLEYLNSKTGCRIIIKPVPYSNLENLAVFPVLQKSQNLHLVNDRSFENALSKFEIKAVILDHLSTTFYEILADDVEIFYIGDDKVRPFESNAFIEFKERVHYSDSVEGMIPLLELYFAGKLEKKRDNTFYHHYVCKQNTEENIVDLIKKLTA